MVNRRKKGPSFWRYLLLGLLAAFIYIWQQGYIVNLGYQIQAAESEYRELLMENRQLHAQLLFLKSATAIRRRITELGLPLVEPKGWNIYEIKKHKEQ